jgi:hypothetical protein
VTERFILLMDDEGGEGDLSAETHAAIDRLVAEDTILALDVIGDWLGALGQKYDAAFRKQYPTLVSEPTDN